MTAGCPRTTCRVSVTLTFDFDLGPTWTNVSNGTSDRQKHAQMLAHTPNCHCDSYVSLTVSRAWQKWCLIFTRWQYVKLAFKILKPYYANYRVNVPEMIKNIFKIRKQSGKNIKMLVTSIFSFLYKVFKHSVSWLHGNGLNTKQLTISVESKDNVMIPWSFLQVFLTSIPW